jgi:hypothetical protein
VVEQVAREAFTSRALGDRVVQEVAVDEGASPGGAEAAEELLAVTAASCSARGRVAPAAVLVKQDASARWPCGDARVPPAPRVVDATCTLFYPLYKER